MADDEIHQRAIARSYDAEYAVVRDPSGDRAFYAELARETGGPVLELACGTGRVLLPIAREGISWRAPGSRSRPCTAASTGGRTTRRRR